MILRGKGFIFKKNKKGYSFEKRFINYRKKGMSGKGHGNSTLNPLHISYFCKSTSQKVRS